MPADRVVRFWEQLENALVDYSRRFALICVLGLREYAELYLGCTFLWLLLHGWLTTLCQHWILLVFPAVYLVDSVLVNVAIVRITSSPRNTLRSIVLAFGAFTNVIVAFAALYAVNGSHFTQLLHFPRSLYFSLATMTTLGESIGPKDSYAATLIGLQLFASLLFLSVIVATVVGWPSEPRGKPISDKPPASRIVKYSIRVAAVAICVAAPLRCLSSH